MLPLRLVISLLFCLGAATVFAGEVCEFPNRKDPDEFFDNIGKTQFCSREDEGAPYRDSRETRENLGSGFTSSSGGNSEEGGRAIAVGTGGVIFIAGRTLASNNDFLIMKYFADGSLDTSFDTDGKMLHSFGTTDDWAHGIALQTDGRIVVVGRSDHGVANAFDFAAIRILTNGTTDTTFETDGKVLVDVSGSRDFARAVVIQTDSRIVIGGYGWNSTDYDAAFVRLTTDGILDTTFNSDGKLMDGNASSDNSVLALTIDSLGKIVGAGTCYTTTWEFAAHRLQNDGSMDTSFKTNGRSRWGITGGQDDVAYAVVTDLANDVILIGSTNNGANLDFAAIKVLNSSGDLDTAFATSGKLTRSLQTGDEKAFGAGITTDGLKLILGGYSSNGTNNDFVVVRLMSDGVFDTSFSTDGIFPQTINSAEDTAQAVYLKGDEVILAGGRTDVGASNYDFALMRIQQNGVLAESGQKVVTFGTNGWRNLDFSGTDIGRAIVSDRQGKIVIAGTSSNATDWLVARFGLDGNIDTSFTTAGWKLINGPTGGTDDAHDIKLQSDGKLAVAGAMTNTGLRMAIARLETSGALDTSFATVGRLAASIGTAAYAVEIHSTGAYLLIGQDTAANDFAIGRITSNGTGMDTSFVTTGRRVFSEATTDGVRFGFREPNGMITAVGIDLTTNAIQLARIHDQGPFDTSFATDGAYHQKVGTTGGDTMVPPTVGAARTSSGETLVASASDDGDVNYIAVMSRWTVDGRLDTSFATRGAYQSVQGISIITNKGLVVAPNDKASLLHGNGGNVVIIRRFQTSGALDTSFATDGINTDGNYGATAWSGGMTIMENGWLCATGGIARTAATNAALVCYWQ